MSAGRVAAISSTFCAVTAVVDVADPAPEPELDSVLLAHPDNVKAPATANTAPARHQYVRLSCPVSTVALLSVVLSADVPLARQ